MNYHKELAKSQKIVYHDCHKIKSSIAPVRSDGEDMPKKKSKINEGVREMRNAST